MRKRPNRKMSATGNEQSVVRTEQTGQRVNLVLRQVGWIGQTGDFYSLDEDPSPTEPGSFAPLWFVAHEDVLEDLEPTVVCWPKMNAQLLELGYRWDRGDNTGSFVVVDNGNGHEWAEVGR